MHKEQIYQSILDALPHHIALLDSKGSVIAVNQAWRTAASNGAHRQVLHAVEGENYLALCQQSDIEIVVRMAQAMQAVLSGEEAQHVFDYAIRNGVGEHHYRFHSQLIGLENEPALLVIHYRLDDRPAEAFVIQDTELNSLEYLIRAEPANVTASTFGLLPLSAAQPESFAGFVAEYQGLLDLALDERMYRVDHQRAQQMRDMAARLGFLKAGPKDVVEIHSVALKEKTRAETYQKAQAYVSEGRLLVLELMGYLVSYYRSRVVITPLSAE